MGNIFSLALVVITSIAGFLWFKELFLSLKRERVLTAMNSTIGSDPTNESLKKKREKSKWIEIISSSFPMLVIVLIVRSFIYEPFHIPSGSMMPTLLAGDFIIVEKFSYGIKDPVFRKTIIKTSHPKRGDIVVFRCPQNPRLNYIKRTIGIPGDRITYDSIAKEITIYPNYKSDAPCYKNSFPIVYLSVEKSNFIQDLFKSYRNRKSKNSFKFLETEEIENNNTILVERKETLGTTAHSILIAPVLREQVAMYYRQKGQPLSTWIVPPGHYFMMGDNRDNSVDSRYWGFVPEKNLVGKARIIWMSFEKLEGKFPSGMRLNRIGRIR